MRAKITNGNDPRDPPIGAVLPVLDVQPDAVIVAWKGMRWPMLPEHTETAATA